MISDVVKMNCTACSASIDKESGYYLVMGDPYCTRCYQAPDDNVDIWTHPLRREPENLLEAFRAYQKRSQSASCQRY